MVIVKFVSKSGLKQQGERAGTAASKYEEAIDGSHKTLTLKASGSYGKALTEFQNKLNEISDKVFIKFPTAIRLYGNFIDSYVSEIEGIGFTSDTLRTQKTPINHVKKWLEKDTYSSFSELKTSLEAKLKDGQEALKLNPDSKDVDYGDLSKILTSVEDELRTLAKNRETVHSKLEDALSTFKSNLSGLQKSFADVNIALKNARHLSGIKASEYAELIKEKYLNETNMTEINSIQAKGDAEVLKILLREKSTAPNIFFKQLGEADTREVSPVMADKIYSKIHHETLNAMETGDTKYLNIFTTAISQQDYERARSYSEKMTYAADRYGELLSNKARELNPQLKGKDGKAYKKELDENTPYLQLLGEELKATGHLSSLFEAMYINHIGQKRQTASNLARPNIESKTINEKSLKFIKDPNGNVQLRFDVSFEKNNKKQGDPTSIVATRYEGVQATEGASIADEYNSLNKKRREALMNFALDAASLGTASEYSFLLNTVRNGKTLFSEDSGPSERVSLITKQHNLNKDQFGQKYKDMVGKWPTGLSSSGSFLSTMYNIEQNAEKLRTKENNNLYNIGGYNIKDLNDIENGRTYFKPQFDLQAILQMDDMQKNGMRTYIYDVNNEDTLEAYDKAMKNYTPISPYNNDFSKFIGFEDNKQRLASITPEIRDLLAGKGGMDQQDPVKVFNAITTIQDYKSRGSEENGGIFGLYGKRFDVEDYITNRNEFFSKILEVKK